MNLTHKAKSASVFINNKYEIKTNNVYIIILKCIVGKGVKLVVFWLNLESKMRLNNIND